MVYHQLKLARALLRLRLNLMKKALLVYWYTIKTNIFGCVPFRPNSREIYAGNLW